MKIDKVYINKEGAPMVLRPWPELDITHAGSSGEAEGMRREWIKRMEQAKRDAVQFDTSHEQTARSLRFPITICDSFIDVDIEVEFVKQYKPGPNDSWVDVPKGDGTIFAWQTRTIARVVPEKAENGAHSYTESAYDMPAGEKRWREEQHERDKAYYKDHDVLFATIANSLIKSGEDIPDANDIATAIIPDIESYMKQQLAAAQARIKQLEQDDCEGFEKYQELLIQNRKLSDRVKELENALAKHDGLRNIILDSFNNVTGVYNPESALKKALDELGIK